MAGDGVDERRRFLFGFRTGQVKDVGLWDCVRLGVTCKHETASERE